MDVKEAIERIKRKITIGECEKNIGIPVYISDLKAVLSELEKKDKIIDEMAKFIAGLDIDEEICKNINHCTADDLYTNCEECIKEYFRKKV